MSFEGDGISLREPAGLKGGTSSIVVIVHECCCSDV